MPTLVPEGFLIRDKMKEAGEMEGVRIRPCAVRASGNKDRVCFLLPESFKLICQGHQMFVWQSGNME